MKFEFIDLNGLSFPAECEVPNEPVSIVNLHTALFLLFLVSKGEKFDLARAKLDELGYETTASLLASKWPLGTTKESIESYADILLSA